MNSGWLALRLAWREWRAGELRALFAAVAITVAALASVNAFTLRMHLALDLESNRLLGADMVLASDHPIALQVLAAARARRLRVAQTAQFPSMVSTARQNVLAMIKAVSPGYPLRGRLRIAWRMGQPDWPVDTIPPRHAVWLEAQLAQALGVGVGDDIQLGDAHFRVAALLTSEPDRGGDFINLAPRLLMNIADLPATGLVVEGSRVDYHALFAGESRDVQHEREVLSPRLERGQRLLSLQDARPQVREVLDQAERYLRLAALLSVLLSSVAVLLATRQFVRSHLDACALLRCFGASQHRIITLYATQLTVLGVLAALIGGLVGWGGQAVLAQMLGRLAQLELPAASALPFVQAALAGLVLLAGFSLPPLLALRRVPALRILRREASGRGSRYDGVLAALAGLVTLTALLFWQTGDAGLTARVLVGVGGVLGSTAAVAWLLVQMIGWIGERGRGSWRQGLLNLRRRTLGSVIQIVAFTLGILALLLLTVVRDELLQRWQATLPANAPNRFIIHVQPDQRTDFLAWFRRNGLPAVQLYPMIRGRLVAINGHEVRSGAYADAQTRRLLDREFNLSYAVSLGAQDGLSAGSGWSGSGAPPQFSVEQGIAERLHLRLGDRLGFDVAGTPVSARITSLRAVKWDSFHVNFFVIGTEGLLRGQPTSFITSFRMPPGQDDLLDGLVRAEPNLVVIDVSAILQELQQMLYRVSMGVQFVFVFSVAAGLAVLYAGLMASRRERVQETALWRVFGARREQLWAAQVAEFATIGVLSGVLAAAGASMLAWRLSALFQLVWRFDPALWAIAAAAGGLSVTLAGMAGLWGISRVPPLVALREQTLQ